MIKVFKGLKEDLESMACTEMKELVVQMVLMDAMVLMDSRESPEAQVGAQTLYVPISTSANLFLRWSWIPRSSRRVRNSRAKR